MNISEAIKNKSNYIITKSGKILGINNIDKISLKQNVKKVETIEGLYADITCVRV